MEPSSENSASIDLSLFYCVTNISQIMNENQNFYFRYCLAQPDNYCLGQTKVYQSNLRLNFKGDHSVMSVWEIFIEIMFNYSIKIY